MRVIQELRRERNPLKRFVRGMLPRKWYHRLGDRVVRMNRKRSAYPKLDPALREMLGAFYRPHNEEFQRLTGLDISGWTGMS